MAIDVVICGEEAKVKGTMKDARTCTWTGWMNGHWTRDRPVRPGRYRIASLDGVLVGEIVAIKDPANPYRTILSQEWNGWFWSFPTPPPPMPVPHPDGERAFTRRPIPPPPPLPQALADANDAPADAEDGDMSNVIPFRRASRKTR